MQATQEKLSGVRPIGRGYQATEVVQMEIAAHRRYVREMGLVGRVADQVLRAKGYRRVTLRNAARWDKIPNGQGNRRVKTFLSLFKSLGLEV